MEQDFIKQAVFSFVRIFLSGVISWIALHFGLTENVTTTFVVGAITAAVMFLWSLVNKWRYETKIDVALDARPGTTRADLKEIIANQ